MLLFGSHGGEDDAGDRQAQVLSVLLDIGLTHGREAQQPEHTVGHTLQDLHEHESTVSRAARQSVSQEEHAAAFNERCKTP